MQEPNVGVRASLTIKKDTRTLEALPAKDQRMHNSSHKYIKIFANKVFIEQRQTNTPFENNDSNVK